MTPVSDTSRDNLASTQRAEHLSDAKSKKVTLRALDLDSGDWVNIAAISNGDGTFSLKTTGASLSPVADYDYLDVQQTSATVETYVFKTGGSGGTIVRTIVVTYTDSTKDDIDTVTWS